MCMDIHFTFFFFFCLDLPVRFQFWVTENEKFSKTFKHNLKKKKKAYKWMGTYFYLFIYLFERMHAFCVFCMCYECARTVSC